MVIPDSIEPVIGWKGLNYRDGVLVSPSHHLEWPIGAPIEALCPSAHRILRTWKATPETQLAERPYPSSEMHYGGPTDNWVYMVTSVGSPYLVEHVAITYDMEDPPRIQFGYPVEWGLDKELHHGPPPSKDCSCGIYMADAPTFSYGPIQVEIVGWGTVIPGTQGAKAQFAYPKRIFVPDQFWKDRGKLERYGVPVLRFSEIPGQDPEPTEEPLLRITPTAKKPKRWRR